MSLTSYVAEKEVTARLKPYRTRGGSLKGAILVPPTSTRPQLLGTAFDYLLRFEIQLRHPNAEAAKWVAEQVPDRIWRRTPDGGGVGLHLFPLESEHSRPPQVLARDTRIVIDEARQVLDRYLASPTPDLSLLRPLATSAVKLAKLDSVIRAGKLDPAFATADEEDVNELLALLAVVPFDRLIRPGRVMLNPTFGPASVAVGGADADLITGDLLVDIKTTKTCELKGESLDQLFGYFLLARRARQSDPSFPEIRSVGLYFSRFGYLWTHDVDGWIARPNFADTERWFFERIMK